MSFSIAWLYFIALVAKAIQSVYIFKNWEQNDFQPNSSSKLQATPASFSKGEISVYPGPCHSSFSNRMAAVVFVRPISSTKKTGPQDSTVCAYPSLEDKPPNQDRCIFVAMMRMRTQSTAQLNSSKVHEWEKGWKSWGKYDCPAPGCGLSFIEWPKAGKINLLWGPKEASFQSQWKVASAHLWSSHWLCLPVKFTGSPVSKNHLFLCIFRTQHINNVRMTQKKGQNLTMKGLLVSVKGTARSLTAK